MALRNSFANRQELIESIREYAQDLIDNCEEYIGSTDNLENVDIRMYFARNSIPSTDIETRYSVTR